MHWMTDEGSKNNRSRRRRKSGTETHTTGKHSTNTGGYVNETDRQTDTIRQIVNELLLFARRGSVRVMPIDRWAVIVIRHT